MSVFRKNLIFRSCLIAALLLLGRPSFSETAISEQTLPGDIVIEKMYRPGSGLPLGKIQSVRGEAIVFHRDPTVGYRIESGLPLYAGDILRTRESAWILCRLIDGSHIVLTSETTLTILKSNYNPSRKTSATLLYLEYGGARFKLNPMPDLSAYEYKVQTQKTFTLASEADFVVQANPAATEITAFENSRLEVTSEAKPEAVSFLSDFQRIIISEEIISPAVETLSREDIEILMTAFSAVPARHIFSSRPQNEDRNPNPAKPEMNIED